METMFDIQTNTMEHKEMLEEHLYMVATMSLPQDAVSTRNRGGYPGAGPFGCHRDDAEFRYDCRDTWDDYLKLTSREL